MEDTMQQLGEAARHALPKRRGLAGRPAGGEVLLRDPKSSAVHFLSATAAHVWECCDGETTAAECVSRLRGAFAIPEGTDVDGDVREAVEDFARRGLLEGPASDAG